MAILRLADARKPLRFLHLRSRTIETLRKARIRQISQFAELPETALRERFPNRHQGGRRDSQRARRALLLSISDNGAVDWVQYARRCGFPILPSRLRDWTQREVVEILPDLAIEAVRIRYGATAVRILKRQLLGPATGRPTLETTGRSLGLTKERVRQIQQAVQNMLRAIVVKDNFTGCAFYIRPELLVCLRKLVRKLDKRTGPAMTYAQWESHVCTKWKLAPKTISNVERLILGITGFTLLTFPENTLKPLMCRKARRKNLLLGVANWTLKLLRDTHHRGIRLRDLQKAVSRKFKRRKVTANEINTIIKSLADVEKKSGLYLAEISTLWRATDRYERVLKGSHQPLHYREIAARAGQYSREKFSEHSMLKMLSNDPRFIPTSGRGVWGLAEWDVETRTIIQIASDELRRARRPLDEDELYRRILMCRPAQKSSIPKLLSASGKFKRVGPKLWALGK